MRSSLTPRYWAALILGLFSAFILSILLTNGEVSARLKHMDEPVLISTGAVKNGDTLSIILRRHGLPNDLSYQIQKNFSQVFDLRSMQPEDEYEIVTSTWGEFRRFKYKPDLVRSYFVIRSTDGVYAVDEKKKKTVWVEKSIVCEVNINLNKDLQDAGYTKNFSSILTDQLGDEIFAWRIDFFTEQQKGDKLEVLFLQEQLLGSDEPIPGHRLQILAASYTGRGTKDKKNMAYRYQAPGEEPEYFDEKGKTVKRPFLRAPFTHRGFRISSRFNPRRYHPIRRVYRPHHGTDYAAMTGTNVAAIGSGVVSFAGWKGGYGKTIEIRHSNKYTSRYGHLSRIRVNKGTRVNQGDHIGNVGSTGLSTGPHLHFEMIVNGTQKDFLRMSFPAAKSISAKDLDEFKKIRDEYDVRLQSGLQLASAVTR